MCQAPGYSGVLPALSSYCSRDLTRQVHSLHLFYERGHWSPRGTMNMLRPPSHKVRAEPQTHVCSTGKSARNHDLVLSVTTAKVTGDGSCWHLSRALWAGVASFDSHSGPGRQGTSLTEDKMETWRMEATGQGLSASTVTSRWSQVEGDLGYAHHCVCTSTF